MPRKLREDGPDWTAFTGYASPNYTQVPDQLFDEHLCYLSGAELKVLLYIIRRTFGFKKHSDTISLSQMLNGIERRDGTVLDRGVGLSKKTLLQALRDLQEKRLIVTERRQSQERGNEPTSYSLNMASDALGEKTTPPLGEKVHQGGGGEIPPRARSKNSPTQETVLQETVLQETVRQEIDTSNIRKVKPSQIRLEADHTSTQPITPDTSVSGERKNSRATPPSPRGSSVPGVSSIGDVLAGQMGKRGFLGAVRRQKAYPEDRQQILSFITDCAIEMGDEAPLPSSVTRTYNIYRQSGMPIEAFVSFLYEARALTKEYSGNVKKETAGPAGPFGPGKNKMPYFFSILEELVRPHRLSPGAEDTS